MESCDLCILVKVALVLNFLQLTLCCSCKSVCISHSFFFPFFQNKSTYWKTEDSESHLLSGSSNFTLATYRRGGGNKHRVSSSVCYSIHSLECHWIVYKGIVYKVVISWVINSIEDILKVSTVFSKNSWNFLQNIIFCVFWGWFSVST